MLNKIDLPKLKVTRINDSDELVVTDKTGKLIGIAIQKNKLKTLHSLILDSQDKLCLLSEPEDYFEQLQFLRLQENLEEMEELIKKK